MRKLQTKSNSAIVNSVAVSFFIALFFMLFVIMMNLQWESHDDIEIAYALSAIGNNFSLFQNKILSIVISVLYSKITVVQWWLVFSLACIGIGTFAVVYIIKRRYPNMLFWPFAGIMLCFVWFTGLYKLNFTRTATIVAFGGCLLLAQSLFETQGKKIAVLEYALGIVLLIVGGMIRAESALLAFGVLGVLVAYQFLFYEGFSFKLLWFKSHGKQIFAVVFVGVLLCSSMVAGNALLTTKEKESIEYNKLRSSIQDYSSSYPSWEEASAEYEAMGFFEGDQELFIEKWFSEDTEVFSTEVLQQFSSMYQRKFNTGLAEHVVNSVFKSYATYVAVILLLLLAFLNKKKNIIPCLLAVGIMFCFSFYFICVGRLPMRIFETTLYMVVCMVLFLAQTYEDKKENHLACVIEQQSLAQKNNGKKAYAKRFSGFTFVKEKPQEETKNDAIKFYPARWLVPIVVSIVMVVAVFDTSLTQLKLPSYNDESKKEYREMSDYFNEQDKVYFFPIYGAPVAFDSGFSIWEPIPRDYWDNVFTYGGWLSRMPFMQERLSNYNIDNPFVGVIENPNVYSEYYPFLLEFLQNHYDENITVSRVDDAFGYSLVQYTKPIADSEITKSDLVKTTIQQFEYKPSSDTDAWFISGKFSDIPAEYKHIYCNITVNNSRYTYRIALSGNDFVSYFYGIPENFKTQDANVTFFARNAQGEYVLLGENLL